MFDLFKTSAGKGGESDLTSLDLRTEPVGKPQSPPPSTAGASANPKHPQEATSGAPPAPLPSCLSLALNPELMLVLGKDFRRRSDEWEKSEMTLQVIFYLVFPQQGHTVSVSSKDGTKTIVPIFGSPWIAKAYMAGRGIQAGVAACRLYALSDQADKWVAAGINLYALNPCFRCGNATLYPIAELQSEEQFLQTWRFDGITRRIFAEIIVRNCQNQLGSNRKNVRDLLERVRDHLDCGMPYLHWVIAILAGLDGDMQANSASIRRLEEFGPDFQGKLKGTSFDFKDAGSQFSTMPEAMLGLMASYGLVNIPMKPATS